MKKTKPISSNWPIKPMKSKPRTSVTGEDVFVFLSKIEKSGSTKKPKAINRTKTSAPH